jgi:hypothetical protein
MHGLWVVAVLALLTFGGCDAPEKPEPAPPAETAPPMPDAKAPAAAAFTPAGQPEAMKPANENGLQGAASVVELTYLQNQGDYTVKLFGTAGGDPAMNGLYTYLAFYVGSASGWRIFKLGDFLEYRVAAEEPGRIDLEIKESEMNDGSGEISSRLRRIIISWPRATGGEPEVISVTPAT